LVALSVPLSLGAAYAALDLAGRVTTAHRWPKVFWLVGGATAMGLGILAMHYIGMAAMRLPAMMEYRWDRVALSIALAVVISLAALVLGLRVRQEQKTSPRKILSAVLMGGAIPSLHYTGMWAVQFRASEAAFNTIHALRVSSLGIAVISIVSFFVLVLTMTMAFLDRLLTTQKAIGNAARTGEEQFRTLAEAIPQIVWTTGPDGSSDYANKRWYEVMRLTEAQTLVTGWLDMIHPDDRAPCLEAWERSLRIGENFEFQYRLRDERKGFRWYLGRATPLRDSSGAVIKWFGTCTDVEDQRHQLEILEEQIKERTEELAETNTRLHEEIWERDVARKELDQQNERMLKELSERSQRATLLTKMGEHLQSCLTKDEVYAAALGFAPKVFLNPGGIALLNPERNLAKVIGSWKDCELLGKTFEPSACWALRTGHPHLVPAGDATAPCSHAAGVKHTYLCIPILAQGEALGIMHFQATDESPSLGEAELSFKTTFAGQVGLSIANINLRDALRTQSIKDTLTGLYNRRYLEEMMEREIRRAARAEQTLGVLMLDLDHFKTFNDTYGHDAGDAVLRQTASFVAKSVRAEDTVCRFGGEEFVVILPTANLGGAQNRAEHIRSKLRELTVLHHGQSVGMITVSIGVSAFPTNGSSSQELLAAADAALYHAKRKGRDRVVVAETASVESNAGGRDVAKA
jgi:diguanylate cyclase (GGDEF)-like protein/PAS domain S-box-containing protein